MALKAMLFLLAFVLLVSTQVTSMEEEILTEKHYHDGHAKAPTHAPAHSPKKAPAYAPAHSPKKTPSHPPKKAPVYPPEISHHHNHGQCVEMCAGPRGYCRYMKHSKRECERACVPCCDQYKCVPEPNKKCNWDKVWHDNQWVKCP